MHSAIKTKVIAGTHSADGNVRTQTIAGMEPREGTRCQFVEAACIPQENRCAKCSDLFDATKTATKATWGRSGARAGQKYHVRCKALPWPGESKHGAGSGGEQKVKGGSKSRSGARAPRMQPSLAAAKGGKRRSEGELWLLCPLCAVGTGKLFGHRGRHVAVLKEPAATAASAAAEETLLQLQNQQATAERAAQHVRKRREQLQHNEPGTDRAQANTISHLRGSAYRANYDMPGNTQHWW
jgi:hypothetical protein